MKIIKELANYLSGKYIDLDSHNAILDAVRSQHKEDIAEIRSIAKRKIQIPVAGFDSIDNEPTDTKTRASYCERVDSFYEDILKDKLYTSIAEVRELYGDINIRGGLNLDRESYDWFVRGLESGLFKINEWCVLLSAEHQAQLQDKENKEQ